MSHRNRFAFIALLSLGGGLLTSSACDSDTSSGLEVPEPSLELELALAAPPRAPIELPSLAMRRWFHAVGEGIVGGSVRYEIRSQGGEVRFTPGAVDTSGRVVAGEPLALRTRRVGRGDDEAAESIEQFAIDGRLHIEHEQATEIWVAGPDAAEQSFHFDQLPSGDGDLVVEISTSGLDCVESTSAGLRFANHEGTSGVSYGHGIFIGADGTETHVPALCDASGITLRVPATVVDKAEYPAVLDPVVGPSFELTEPIGESGDGSYPGIACSDETCLVAFIDDRDGTERRYVGRFTPSGVLLDEQPQIVGPPPVGPERVTRVGHLQDRFLLVFRQGTNAMGQFIGEGGDIIGSPFVVATAVSGNIYLACGDSDCLVSWIQLPASLATLRANHIALDGSVTSPSGFIVSNTAEWGNVPKWAQGRYFVPYHPAISPGDDALEVKRVQDGVVLDASPIVLIPQSFVDLPPTGIATNGTDLFVTGWASVGPPSQLRRRGTFLSNGGVILPPGAGFMMNSPVSATATNFDFAWNGTSYSAIYATSALFTYVTSADGSSVSAPVQIVAGGVGNASMVPLPSGGAVVAFEDPFTAETMSGQRLDATGQLQGGVFPITYGDNDQTSTAVARGVGQYLVAWFDRRLDSTYVVAARVAANGTVLDPTGIVIAELSTENTPNDLQTAGLDAVWNGSSFMVVWADQTDDDEGGLRAARVSAAGNVLDALPTQIRVGDTWSAPSIAWSGVVHMVAYKSGTGSSLEWVSRLDAAGNLIDGISLFSYTSAKPQIAWTGTEFLITSDSGYRTVTAAGVVQQADAVPLPGVPSVRGMACNGTSCSLALHSSFTLRSAPFNALTKTLGASTTIQSSLAVTTPTDLVWDGSRFVTVYGVSDLVAWTPGATPATVESSPNVTAHPSLASLGTGQSLLAYTLQDLTPGSVTRVYASIIDGAGDPGLPCALPGDCESGFCVEGVCCDTACGGGNPNDCQACTTAAGAATNGVCGAIAVSTICRAANGVCDAAETCDGMSGSCPADGFSSGTECRASNGLCDAAEQCNGTSTQCPVNVPSPAGTVCRGAASECDVVEACNGSSNACPADAAVAPGTACIGTPNACVTQACAGTIGASATCQATPRPAGSVCRIAAGLCDEAETCDGVGSPCPSDTLQPAGEVCRVASGPCDLEEACDGSDASCPADVKVAVDTVCRVAVGECDVAESCDGAGNACPSDMGAAAGTSCGAAPMGGCELPSTCAGGATTSCEPNYEPAGTSCRVATGACDAEEACDGASADCPEDLLVEAGEVCANKDPANDCDVDDVCDGIVVDCMPNVAADGTSCEAAGADGSCEAGECEPNGDGGSGGTSTTGGSGPGGAGGSGGTPSTTAGSGSGGAGGETTTGGGAEVGGASAGSDGDGDAAPDEGCSCQTPRGRTLWDGAGGVGLMAVLLACGRRAAGARGRHPGVAMRR